MVNHWLAFPVLVAGVAFLPRAFAGQELTFESSATKAALVELYTSEGCSSCPPAEDWLGKLKSSPGLWKDVFPVAFHVNYWDNLGWPDRFATSTYTRRQREYVSLLGQESPYTPEFIVSGKEWRRSWLNSQTLPTVAEAKSGHLAVTVGASGTTLAASYEPASADVAAKPLQLNVAVLGSGITSDVQRGENGGRTLTHEFVVLNYSIEDLKAGSGNVFASEAVDLKSQTDDAPAAVVAWVSTTGGEVLQVTGGWLKAAK